MDAANKETIGPIYLELVEFENIPHPKQKARAMMPGPIWMYGERD